MRLIAELTAARSRVGLCSTRGTWLNAITPTFTCLGTWERKRKAARLAAVRRFGATYVAVIEPDTSVASMIEARSTGTATVRSGLAAATISAGIASPTAASGTWRRQRGRFGARLVCSTGLANEAAAALRLR